MIHNEGTFQAYLSTLDEWEQELLSNLRSPWSVYEVADILNGKFCIVSDGAASRNAVGSYAWVLSSPSGQRVLNGCGPVRGGRISSYRAEAWGVLAAVRIIHHITEYTMRTLPFEGHMACDNKAVVHQVHTFLPTMNTSTTPARVNPAEVYLHPLSAEWDVLIEIYHTVKITWSATTIEHIKGHQDDDKPVSQLPLLAQLNIEADHLASTHQRRHPEPAPRARLLRHTGVHLHLPTGTVTSRYDQALRQAYTAPLSISYLQERFSWTPAVFTTIHWEAHGKALRRQRSHHVHFTKLVYDILPTNRVQHRYNSNISPLCPCCNAVEETRDHLLRCPETETWRRELVGVLRTRCDELHTSPRLRDYLLRCLQDWLAHGDHMPTGEYPSVFKPITDTQTAIGWRHLFSARFSMEWATAQSCYLEQRQLLEPTSAGDRWVVEISTTIWNKWRELWQHRNSIVHGKGADDQRRIQRTQLERRIHQVYAQQNKVEPSMSPVFAQPEHTHVGKGNIHMSNWLAVHETAVFDSVTRATKRAIQGMRSILTYFGTDRGAETG